MMRPPTRFGRQTSYQPMSGSGTKRNCLGAHGISGAEGRPAVPSTWRRQPPLTHCGHQRQSLGPYAVGLFLCRRRMLAAGQDDRIGKGHIAGRAYPHRAPRRGDPLGGCRRRRTRAPSVRFGDVSRRSSKVQDGNLHRCRVEPIWLSYGEDTHCSAPSNAVVAARPA